MTAGRQSITKNKDWGTPQIYANAVREFFGGIIHLDPCSSIWSIVYADTEYTLPQHDGLKESWDYPTIYVNPPFGRDIEHHTTIGDWLYRCETAYRIRKSEVIALIPVATNTRHWKDYIWGKATAVCFLYDTRLRFLINGKNDGKGAPMSCAMVYWGNAYGKFFESFLKFGAVVNIEDLRDEQIGRVEDA